MVHGTKNNIAVHHDCSALKWVKKEEGIYCISSGWQVKKGWCRPFSSLLVYYLLSHCDSFPSSLSHRQNYTCGLRNSTKNPCSEPPTLYQGLSTLHEWDVKKILSICQSGWREIWNTFPVIHCSNPLGPRTRISALLRRRYSPGIDYVCGAGYLPS